MTSLGMPALLLTPPGLPAWLGASSMKSDAVQPGASVFSAKPIQPSVSGPVEKGMLFAVAPAPATWRRRAAVSGVVALRTSSWLPAPSRAMVVTWLAVEVTGAMLVVLPESVGAQVNL